MFDLHDLGSRRAGKARTSLVPTSGGVIRGVVLLAMLVLSGLAEAKTVYVNGAISKPGKGATWTTAFKYLRDALEQTSAGDQIYLAKGTYYPDDGKTGEFGNREMTFELKGQKLFGGYAGSGSNPGLRNPSTNVTILSGAIWGGANAGDFFSLHIAVVEKDTTLDGLILEDGHANGGHSWTYPRITAYDRGGACYVEAGNVLTLNNCIFRDNRALQEGGAIMIEEGRGKVIATNCTFERNEVLRVYNIVSGNSGGGAIKGNVEAINCKFTSNVVTAVHPFEGTKSAAHGGAISGNVKATGCVFTGNQVDALTGGEVEPTADGGAVYGNFTGTNCVFTGNQAYATGGPGVSSGGALSGAVINAFNCSFVENEAGIGIPEDKDWVRGGGGAVHTEGAESQLVNCVFVRNTSEFRGGAVQGGVTTDGDTAYISNCTFLDNGVAEFMPGAALSCGGLVRCVNNIFWYTAVTDGTYERDKPIHLSFSGGLRNSDDNYPTPLSAAPNILRGGDASITNSLIPDKFLVSPSILIVDADPLFANAADPDGADNRWGTADDGLRLSPGSPAIGRLLDPRVTKFVNVLPKDINDIDGDKNVAERLPSDLKGHVRVQNSFVEMGAYEYGSLANLPDIAVTVGGKNLSDGGSRSFGTVATGKKGEMTFTIKNVGTNGLGSLSVVLSGAKEFTLKKPSTKKLDPNAKTTFTVSFKPKTSGKYSGKITIISSDPDEGSFDIKLTAKATGKKSTSKSKKQDNGKSGGDTNPDVTIPDDVVAIPLGFAASSSPSGTVVTTTTGPNGTRYLMLTILKSGGWTGGTVEVSSDLLNWYSGKTHTTVLEDSATLLRVRDNTPVTGNGKRFIRLK